MPPTATQDAWIRDVFGVDPSSYSSPAAQASAATGKNKPDFGAAAKLWASAVAQTEKDLHAIRKNIADAFEGDAEGRALEQDFLEELNDCLKTLDLALHDELRRLESDAGGHTQDQTTDDARKILDAHIKYIDTYTFMTSVDENPFGIKIADRLDKVLRAIERVLG